MNITKSTGESSCKGRENGDASTGSERPLKKARFAWQVKGKYHLKSETDESNKNLTVPSTGPSTSKGSTISQSSSIATGCEVEDYKKQDSKLESVLHSQNSLLMPSTNLPRDQQESSKYPRYFSNWERTHKHMLGTNINTNERTMSMADSAEDQCIAQWQARQVVKGCLDNTLNRVLESWTTDPLPAEEANSRFLALDFAEFINHLPGDNSVENEGILMAISAHGLQNTSSSSSNDASNVDNCSNSSAPAYDMPSPIPSLSAVVSDDDSQQTNDQQGDAEEKLPKNIQHWQCDNQNANDATPFAYFSEPSQSSYNFYDDNHQNSNTDSLEMESHFDFMNTAVLYAIKSKGLTVSGTEYG